MNIALVGYGKMGRLIERRAGEQGINISLIVNSENNDRGQSLTQDRLAGVDVCIDFSTPQVVMENIQRVARAGVNLVVGTTGWHDHLEWARQIVSERGIGFVYASNFSIGMNLFFRLAQYAATLLHPFEGFDPFIEEAHHKVKKDAPSGTAVTLGRLLEDTYADRAVPITSVRAGYIPGTHVVSFDSEVETITLRHVARSRDGFAEGALFAARWIAGRKGFYEFRDIMQQAGDSAETPVGK